MKITPAEAKFFHVDGRSDGRKDRHDEANSRFSRFCSRAFNSLYYAFRVICPKNLHYFCLHLTGLSLRWRPTLCREVEIAALPSKTTRYQLDYPGTKSRSRWDFSQPSWPALGPHSPV